MNDLKFTTCGDYVNDQQTIQRIGFACKYMHPDQTQKKKILEEIQRPLNTRSTTVQWLNRQTTEVSAWEGMLWLFPSWCEHSTPVNKAEERYCISFNTYPRKYEKINIHGD